jgi:zinc protease
MSLSMSSSTSWKELAIVVASLAVAAGCSSKGQTAQHPTLPGEATPISSDDPWAGAKLIEPPSPPAPAAVALPGVTTLELENGLEVLVVEDRDVPVIEVRVAIRAGEREVERGKTGLARFAAQMLLHGTQERSELEIADGIDFAGGSLRAHATHDATWLSCEVLSTELSTCLDLMAELLTIPSFPEEEMGQVDRMLRSEVRARRDDARELAARHLQNALWGDDHARGWILSESTLDAIERADLVSWHRRWFAPNNAILAVAGDVDAEALAGELERAFGGWERRELPERPAYAEPELEGVRVRLVDKPDQTQAHLHVGHLGLSRHDDDFYDAMVVNYVLGGGGFSSRLMRVLRGEEGMTYGASSSFEQHAERGAFMASTFTQTSNTADAFDLLLGEMLKLFTDGPSDDEVQAAVRNLAARYAMRFETAGDTAVALLSARLRDLALDDVRHYPLQLARVDAASARQAAARRLAPHELVAVIVGPARDIAPQLERVGWRYEVVPHHAPIAAYERRAPRERADAPVAPESARRARAILDRALEAKGGYERISAIHSMILEGRAQIQLGPQRLPGRLVRTFAPPNRIRVDLRLSSGLADISTAFDGELGWMRQSAGGQVQVMDLPEAERGEVVAELWRDPELILLRHREDGAIIESMGTEAGDALGGERHHLVRVRSPAGYEVVLAIHDGTSELRRMTYTGPTGGETVDTFGDYRRVGGIAIAHERETVGPQQTMKLTIERVRFDEPIPPARFAKPRD